MASNTRVKPVPRPVLDITVEIDNISSRPVQCGGWADVYTAVWYRPTGNVKVALKVPRYDPSDKKIQKALARETYVWKLLSHPNIQEMCGVHTGISGFPALVSLWSEEGHINCYLAKQSGPQFDLKLRLMRDVVLGLQYLHGNEIVHGDIKGANILISDDGVARLADFGLSMLCAEHSQSFSFSSVVKGTTHWMAPEFFTNDEPRPSYYSDIWALGCLFIEIQSGRPPYAHCTNDLQVILALSKKQIPSRPEGIRDGEWHVIVDCCQILPHSRRGIAEIRADLERLRLQSRLEAIITLEHTDTTRVAASFLDLTMTALRICYKQDHATYVTLFALQDSDFATALLHRVSIWSHSIYPVGKPYPETVLRDCAAAVGRRKRKAVTSHFKGLGPPLRSCRPPDLRPLARLICLASEGVAASLMKRLGSRDICRFSSRSSTAHHVQWLPDGVRLATACGNSAVQVLDASAGDWIRKIFPDPLRNHYRGRSNLVALSPHGLGASLLDDKAVLLWDFATGDIDGRPMIGHTASICAIVFCPTGDHIASGSADTTVRIWSVETRSTAVGPLRGHTDSITCVAYSPDGSFIISGSKDSTLRIWDALTGACVLTPSVGHTKAISAVNYSYTGSSVASASDDGTVSVWNAATGQPCDPRTPWPAHPAAITSLVSTADGSRLASACRDGMIRIWNTTCAGDERFYVGDVVSLAFSPDGTRLASVSGGSVTVWDVTNRWQRWDI